MSRHWLFGSAATVAVGIGIALGLWNLGGPRRQREIAMDQRRSADLARLSSAIDQWYAREKGLPPDVNTLLSYEPGLSLLDPIRNTAYEYQRTGDTQYRLCASFSARETADSANQLRRTRFDSHSAGRQCFNLDAVRSQISP